MREVEKEVVLIDPSPPSSLTDNRSESMNVDSNHTTNDLNVPTPIVQSTLSHVLKVIKKLDVQILCTQHNPVCKLLLYLFTTYFSQHPLLAVGCSCPEEG